MQALVLRGRQLALAQRPKPRPRPGWALVRVSCAGVCRTDLEIVRGYMGFQGVLGHEFVGRVVDGPPQWRGARVVAEINFACGCCGACRGGIARHCPRRRVMGISGADGAFAEYVSVPVRNLHQVPDEVPDECAVFVEPLAAAFEILEQVHIAPGARAVVLGDGKLGLLCAQVLTLAGARVLVVGKHESKLDIVRRRGIEAVGLSGWRQEPADVVVEATGRAEGFSIALGAVRPRGTLVLKSTVAGSVRADLAPLVIHEITLVGSRCGPFRPALQALEKGVVDVRSLVSARFPLARAKEAIAAAGKGGVLKVLIDNPQRQAV